MRRVLPARPGNMRMRSKIISRLPLLALLLFALCGAVIPDLRAHYFNSQAASQTSSPALTFTGSAGSAVRSDIVNLAALAAQQLNQSPLNQLPAPALSLLPENLPLTDLPAPATSSIEVIDNRLALCAPAPITSFAGLRDLATTALGADGAVSNDRLLTILNRKLAVQSKSGEKLANLNLSSFWAGLGELTSYNNRVLYDAAAARWIITAYAQSSSDAAILVGVSETADATGNWHLYRFPADTQNLAVPTSAQAGFNKNWLVVQSDLFTRSTPSSFASSNIYIINKADLYASGRGNYTLISTDKIGGAQTPVVSLDQDSDPLYLIQNYHGNLNGAGYLALYAISGEIGNESLTRIAFPGIASTWAASAADHRDLAPQAGSNRRLQNNDARIQNGLYRNGSIWCAQTIFLPVDGQHQISGVQWWQLGTDGSVVQQGRIIDESGNNYYAFPSIAVNRQSDLLIGYSSFAANQYPSASYALRAAGDPLGTMRAGRISQAGLSPFVALDRAGNNRWAEYSSTVVDPADDLSLWTLQAYAAQAKNGNSQLATQWSKIAPLAAPTISGFTPSSGPVGANVTITGSGFTGATSVNFNGANVSGFNVVSDSQITTTVPAAATNGFINVVTPSGTATSSVKFIISAPILSGFSPNSGTASSTINIFGVNFTGTSAVKFNGTPSTSFNILSDTQITAVVPNGATTGPIVITAPGGAATSTKDFTVLSTATLSGFNPTTGADGTKVNIFGTNFTGATAVSFNGLAATTFRVVSDTQINANVPAGATSGPISVATPGGIITSSTIFTVLPSPAISGFNPTSGAVGTTVTIFGANLNGATAVMFNGVNASITSNTATQLITTVPSGAGTGPITITTTAGTITSANNFTVLSTALISGFAPTSGAAGTNVTIFGTNLTGATAVSFNGKMATTFKVVSDTQITTTVPLGATTGPISVTTPGGLVSSATAFTVPPPTISSFSPSSAPIGATITINGTGLTSVSTLLFNGSAANFNIASDTQITAVVPAATTTGPITITSGNGTVITSAIFTVIPAPVITSFTPSQAPIGAIVSISGLNFTGATSVSFNGTLAASFSVVSDTLINATVPTGATSGPITIAGAGGIAVSTTNFTVDQPDFAISVDPAQLSVVKKQLGTVTINIVRTGGFAGPVTVTPPDTTGLKIKFMQPAQKTSGTSLTFTFKAKKNSPLGVQQLIFTAQDSAGRVRTATLVLTIQ